MNKVTENELDTLLRAKNINLDNKDNLYFCAIYHPHEWDGGFESTNGYSGTKEEFNLDFQYMQNFLYEFIQYEKVTSAIIAPFYNSGYFEDWADIRETDVYKKIYPILCEHTVTPNSNNGLKLDLISEADYLNIFIEGGFRYLSSICLYIHELGILIEPTHNFEYLFYSKNEIEKDIIQIVNSKFQLLKTYH